MTVSPLVGLPDKEKLYAKRFVVSQNYPNPFNPTTTISYQLPVSAEVELTIYNLLGQQIRKLVNTKQVAGSYQIEWNGRDDNGREVASGIYVYRIESAGFIQSKKMLLIR
jgi:flagellar hook assembly protein FlgD